jgi:hypothetical protein
MEIRIDKAGRIVVVPKRLRERLGFKPESWRRLSSRRAFFSSGSNIGLPCSRSMRILEDMREEPIESVLKA